MRTASVVAGLFLGVSLALSGCASGPAAPSPRIKSWTEPTTPPVPTGEATPTLAPGSGVALAKRKALAKKVKLIGAGYAADDDYIIVKFFAPPELAALWQPGQLSVIDEATGTRYDRIPFMPTVGFLIGKPPTDGQVGYVMLSNGPTRLKPGSKVTVVLDQFVARHVIVSEDTTYTSPTP